MIEALHSNSWQNYLNYDSIDSKALPDVDSKSFDTQTDGLTEELFGAVLFQQENTENKFLGALPKVDRSADTPVQFNVGTDISPLSMRVAHNPFPLQSHPEGGDISAPQEFDVDQFSLEIKNSEVRLEQSDIFALHEALQDATNMGELMDVAEEYLDLAIDRDGLATAVSSGDGGYSSYDGITSLDRAIASSGEYANAGDDTDTAFSGEELNYGTGDRTSQSVFDSYVDYAPSADGNRQLTSDLMDKWLTEADKFGGSNPWEDWVLFTGKDTWRVLSELQKGRVEVVANMEDVATDTVNDAETISGLTRTTRFRSYDGIPIIANQNAPDDGDLQRIYGVPMDTINGVPKVSIDQYADPYTETAGRNQAQGYISRGKTTEERYMLQYHELSVRDFSSCGKLRDLAE